MFVPRSVLVGFCEDCGDPIYFCHEDGKLVFTCTSPCGIIDPHSLPSWVHEELGTVIEDYE